jgi:UDPglucose--hexose-1-phosphate uridylyltransferase
MTPPAVAVYASHGGILADGAERISSWRARVFANLYAALVPSPSPPTGEWIALPGKGHHEVIVDSPVHGSGPADFSLEEMELMLQVYRDRYSHYRSSASCISIFKNWGEAAGASLGHTHSQLIALPLLPPVMKRERAAISSEPFCPYCNVVAREAASKRLIAKNDSWILIAPFCSQRPYESWILPRAHISNLEEMGSREGRDLAEIFGISLRQIRSLLNDPPYNYMLYQLPSGYHLNIRIQPALTKMAGFEKSTGIYINPVPPEQAAAELRQV